jgi:hypothetical protein
MLSGSGRSIGKASAERERADFEPSLGYSVFYFGVVHAFRPANTADLKVRTTSESKML